jgi:hypothetical protein
MILLKALSPNRAERYRNAGEFADELSRYLEDEPLSAGRATPLFFFRRWIFRHRRMAAIALIVLVINGLILAWSITRVAAARAEKNALLEQIKSAKSFEPTER